MIKDVVRLRSEKYLKHIRSYGCLVCANYSSAHHLTFAQPKAKALKNGDQYTVPLCHRCHMLLHEFAGGERTWWAVNGIDPLRWAELEYAMWRQINEPERRVQDIGKEDADANDNANR